MFQIDNTIISEVDRLMMEKWEKSDKSIWALNQCYYVGAWTVQQRTRQQRNTKRSENLQTKVVGRKRKKVMDVRSKLGKLVSEWQRRATKGKLKGKLRRNFLNLKLAGVSTRSLKVRITQMRELVKIRKSQLETVDTRRKYAKQNKMYKKMGVKSLNNPAISDGESGPPPAKLEEFKAFWESVMGVEGDYDPRHRPYIFILSNTGQIV